MAKKKPAPGKREKGLMIRITPFSLLLWAAGFLFVLAWVFVLGFFVGRGFLPRNVTAFSDMKTRVKRIQSMLSRAEPNKETPRENKEEEPELVFYEQLSSKKNEVKKQWQAPQKGEIPRKQIPKSGGMIPSRQDRPQIVRGPHKRVDGKEARAAAPDLSFTIQLASLGDGNTAEALTDRLNRKGYPVYYYEVEIKGRIYYRVRYGRYATREEAEKSALELARKEGIKGLVMALD